MINDAEKLLAQHLMQEQERLELAITNVTSELRDIRERCEHPNLSPRPPVGTEYRLTCPDCGHVAYCYLL